MPKPAEETRIENVYGQLEGEEKNSEWWKDPFAQFADEELVEEEEKANADDAIDDGDDDANADDDADDTF